MEAREPVNEENFEIRVDVHGIRDGPRLGRLRASRKVKFQTSSHASLLGSIFIIILRFLIGS